MITRKLKEADIPLWATFFEDNDAVEFLYLESLGLPSNEAIASHMILKQLERYNNKRYGLQVLVDKNTNEFIGLCGLLAQEVDQQEEIEVGYHIFKKHWGKGYATEAAKLFIDYAFQHELSDSIVSVIDIENHRSQRVAIKNGLKIAKQTKWLANEDVYIYSIHKNDWIK